MAFIIKDRVKEGTSSVGIGAIDLSGSASTFTTFNSFMTDGDTTYYAIVHTTSGVDEWEVGLGTWNTGNILTRTTILSGSNGTSAVDFSAGIKDVFMTYPASKAIYQAANGDTSLAGALDIGTSLEVETHIDLNTTIGTKPAHREGRIFYDAAWGALGVYNAEADITLQVGQEDWIKVYNGTGSTITNGTPVYLSGEVGGIPSIVPAKANGTYEESQAVGIATHDIEDATYGYVTARGLVGDIDTSHLTVGEPVHVAPDGGTQTASPTYPFYPTEIGICLISAAVGGCIYVHPRSEAFQTLRVTGNSYVDGNVTVAGNLNVLGSQTISSSANIAIANAWNYFNSGDTIGSLNTAFSGTGLDDASLTGHFTGPVQTNYYVRIDGVGTGTGGVDTFEWSTDNFVTFIAQNVDITGDDQLIHSTDNIAIKFEATTGHTLGDVWTGTGSPVNVDTGFASNRNTGTTGIGYTHLGIYYDVSSNKWTVFDEYDPEPEGAIDTSDPSFSLGTVLAAIFEGNLQGNVTGNLTGNVSGNLTGNSSGTHTGSVVGNVTGNASTATKLATARTVQLSGDVTGSATFDGSANINISAVVQDDSHSHIISNVDGLQAALDSKAPTARVITAGTGITGGGDLTVNRTISLDTAYTDGRYINASGDTMTGTLAIDNGNHIRWNRAAGNAAQRADARLSDTSDSRLHWYGLNDTASERNFRHAWYDGASYIHVTANAGGRIDFGNSATSMYIGTDRVFDDGYHPNADKLTTARTIALAGDVTGSASFDGSGNISITAVVQDDSHNHIISNVDGLQPALDGKLSTTGKAADSNLLDGINSTGFALAQGRVVTDANAAAFRVPGMYGFNSSPTNGTGEAYGAMVVAANIDTGLQIAGGYSNDDLYFRGWSGSGATYYPWRRIFHDNYHPNADKWTTARTLSLTGDASGSVSWDGSGNASLSVTVADDSHNHVWGNIDGASVNGWGGLRNSTAHGYIDFGPANTSYAHIYTDRPSFYFNKGATFEGITNASTFNATSTTGGGFQGIDADSATTPSFTWSADLDTGIYRPTTNQIGFTTGGTVACTISGSNFTVVGALYAPTVDTNSVVIGAGVTLSESTERADLLQISSSTSGWGGLQICNSSNEGRWSFMTDGETAGIYNDEDNQWHMLFTETGGTAMYHNAAVKLATASNGIDVTGDVGCSTVNGGVPSTSASAVGSVGTYAWLGGSSTASTFYFTAGDTYAGSGLRYAGTASTATYSDNTAARIGYSGTPAGTWRAMGGVGSIGRYNTTLFLRIS
jgi:hypothetical protein